MHTPKVLNGIQ